MHTRKILPVFIILGITQVLSAQINIEDSIYSGGMYRNYRLYVPPAYSEGTPAPLLLNLHGYSSDNFGQALYANFNPIADTAGFITVLPNGTIDGFGLRFWNCFVAPGSGVDDVQFLSDLIDSISSAYTIDPNRIYSTGMSNGGFMSHTLACELSEKIAAIASVTGTIDKDRLPYCDPTHNVPVMQIHGTDDATVPYNGNAGFHSVDSVVNFWKAFNHTDIEADFTAIPDLVTTDGCTAEHYVYDNGWTGSSVEHFKILDGGHTWPGTAITFLGVTNQDINACREIWRFLSQYRLDALTAIPDQPSESNHLYLSPNPARVQLSVQSDEPIISIRIIDINGRSMLHQSNVYGTQFEIPVHTWHAGMYFVHITTQSGYAIKQFMVQ